MSNAQERLASTISAGDLSQSDVHETGADYIAASGRSDPLGAALARLKGGGIYNAAALQAAVFILAQRMQKHCEPRRQQSRRHLHRLHHRRRSRHHHQ